MEKMEKRKKCNFKAQLQFLNCSYYFCLTISQVLVLSKIIGFGCISASRILINPVCLVRQFEVVTSEFCFRNRKIGRTKTQRSFV